MERVIGYVDQLYNSESGLGMSLFRPEITTDDVKEELKRLSDKEWFALIQERLDVLFVIKEEGLFKLEALIGKLLVIENAEVKERIKSALNDDGQFSVNKQELLIDYTGKKHWVDFFGYFHKKYPNVKLPEPDGSDFGSKTDLDKYNKMFHLEQRVYDEYLQACMLGQVLCWAESPEADRESLVGALCNLDDENWHELFSDHFYVFMLLLKKGVISELEEHEDVVSLIRQAAEKVGCELSIEGVERYINEHRLEDEIQGLKKEDFDCLNRLPPVRSVQEAIEYFQAQKTLQSFAELISSVKSEGDAIAVIDAYFSQLQGDAGFDAAQAIIALEKIARKIDLVKIKPELDVLIRQFSHNEALVKFMVKVVDDHIRAGGSRPSPELQDALYAEAVLSNSHMVSPKTSAGMLLHTSAIKGLPLCVDAVTQLLRTEAQSVNPRLPLVCKNLIHKGSGPHHYQVLNQILRRDPVLGAGMAASTDLDDYNPKKDNAGRLRKVWKELSSSNFGCWIRQVIGYLYAAIALIVSAVIMPEVAALLVAPITSVAIISNWASLREFKNLHDQQFAVGPDEKPARSAGLGVN